jgi:hypothetical protein
MRLPSRRSTTRSKLGGSGAQALNVNVDNVKGRLQDPQLVINYNNDITLGNHRLDGIGFPTIFPIKFRMSPSFNSSQRTDSWMTARSLRFLPLPSLPLQHTVAFWCPLTVGHRYTITSSHPHGTPPSSNAVAQSLPDPFMVSSVLGWCAHESRSWQDPDHPLFASNVTSGPGH